MTVRAGAYVRISRDPGNRQAGVKRQRADCEAYAERKGWALSEFYQDNDVSGYRGIPPRWRAMLTDIEAGKIDAVIIYDVDRLTRQPILFERFLEACQKAKVVRLGSVGGDIDLGTSDGQFMARVLVAQAKKSSDDTSRRIKRAFKERRAAGKPNVGGLTPFGYKKVGDPTPDGRLENVRLEVDLVQAAAVQEATQRILGGASWGSVAREFNERGIKTANGGRWSPYLLRETICKPLVAGLLPDGTEGNWRPIISKRDRTMLLRRVGNGNGAKEPPLPDDPEERDREIRRRRASHAGKAAREGRRRYLLSGIVYCDRCGKKMLGAGGLYRCSIVRSGCGKTSVQAHALERVVLDEVNPLDEKRWRSQRPARTRETERTLDKMETLEQQLDDLAGDLGLTPRQVTVRSRAIQEQLAMLREKLPVGDEEPPAPDPERTGELLQAWATGTLDERGRHLLGGFLARRVEEVRVEPGRGNVPRRTKVTLAH